MKRAKVFWILPFIILILVSVWWLKNNIYIDRYPMIEIDGRSFVVAVADEPAEWQRGLSGQEAQRMMLFVFPDSQQRSFWMQDMLYSIDIVWVDQGRVVAVDSDLPLPGEAADQDLPRFISPQPVDMVLEIPVDFRRESGINIERGDTIMIINI